jgi:FAD:protein FMN transferase
MPRPARMTLFILGAWLCGVSLRAAVAADDFAFFHDNVMGTSLELRVLAESAEAAACAEDRVLGEIDRLSRVFSGYDKTSEFSRWQATVEGSVKLSPQLFELLSACDHWRTSPKTSVIYRSNYVQIK